jgi:regulatory protein
MAIRPERPPPDEASLRDAAMSYLARYASTEMGLRRVLIRRVDRWARSAAAREDTAAHAETAKALVPGIVARMVALGLVNDAAFAESRARGLARSGLSRRAITARLMAKGLGADQARAALSGDADGELVAALILARKRRIGPFRAAARSGGPDTRPPEADRARELGILARAGFPLDIAARALGTDAGAAEDLIRAARE